MGNKIKTMVKIGGREYYMRGAESEEYMHKVAIYVDRKMGEIERRQPGLSTSMITVLTAINLADEVIKQKQEIESLKQEIKLLKENLKDNSRPVIYDVARKNRR